MRKASEFPFHKARKIKRSELKKFRKAYQNTFGEKPPVRGRPSKGNDKYKDVHIKLHPKVLFWAKRQGKRRGIGYQTVINETLLRESA